MDKKKLYYKIDQAIEDVFSEVLDDKPGDITPGEFYEYEEHINGLVDLLYNMLHREEA